MANITRFMAPVPPATSSRVVGARPGEASFTLFGHTTPCGTVDRNVVVGVLTRLREHYLREYGSDFYELAASHLEGRVNRLLARSRYEVYPDNRKRCESASVKELPGGGWWIGVGGSSRSKDRLLKKIREAAGLSPDQLHWQLAGKT